MIEPPSKARECANYQQEAMKFTDQNDHMKIVVISQFWQKWLTLVENIKDSPNDARPGGGEIHTTPLFDKRLKETVEAFTRRGIRVLLIGQAPVYSALPLRCLVAALDHGADPLRCGMPSAEARLRTQASDAALLRLAKTNSAVTVVLPSSFVCPNDNCALMEAGTMLYRDKGHLNTFGARQLSHHVQFPSP